MADRQASRIEALFAERFPKSAEHYRRATKLFPSGVTHDARYLKPFPIYANEALGSHKTTVEKHVLIDYWMGHGAMLLGHSHPAVVRSGAETGCHLDAPWSLPRARACLGRASPTARSLR